MNDTTGFKEMQIETYKHLAKDFDSVQRRENRNHYNKIKAIADFLEIKQGDRVLEIGVGTGIHAEFLLKNTKNKFSFIGVDLSKDMLAQAKKKLKKWKVILKTEDGESLSFKNNSFDKVFISGSLHHFGNPEKGISEIFRVLKKEGKFCIMEPNYFFPKNFFAAHTMPEEKNIRLMRKRNFMKWLKKPKINFEIRNFAYTPPFPKSFIPLYEIIDKAIANLPLLSRMSVMLFVTGEKR